MKRQKIIIRTSLIGVVANLLLVGFKLFVGIVSSSIAIILDAINNLTDVMSAVVTILGTKLASRRPDKEHPYGHGRYEYLTALLIGAIIFATGIMAIIESVPKIFSPNPTEYSWLSAVIILVAVLVKVILGLYVKKIGHKLDSGSLIATGIDALWDAVLSFSTFIGIITSICWGISLDGILGTIIAIFILRSSLEILSDALEDIIGKNIDPATAAQIKQIVLQFPEVKNAYDLKVHNYGPDDAVGSIHIEVPSTLSAKDIYQLSHQISSQIFNQFGIDLTVGIYVESQDTPQSRAIRQKIQQAVQAFPEVTSMHGLYIDDSRHEIIFDVVIPAKSYHKKALREKLTTCVQQLYPDYTCLITFDIDIEK